MVDGFTLDKTDDFAVLMDTVQAKATTETELHVLTSAFLAVPTFESSLKRCSDLLVLGRNRWAGKIRLPRLGFELFTPRSTGKPTIKLATTQYHLIVDTPACIKGSRYRSRPVRTVASSRLGYRNRGFGNVGNSYNRYRYRSGGSRFRDRNYYNNNNNNNFNDGYYNINDGFLRNNDRFYYNENQHLGFADLGFRDAGYYGW
ncbi:hypothetical protein PoB_006564900 [Plakobranchus ocellatus]|uniref:Uncharacterized protein n=1 Tax=Plakobranchus ocellatus TaxID=259542 RepID=A0AAV4D4P7_9GAST|nr:hypothetical protein PoB_006564900 [Plakobranchus ocellatus]